MWVPLLGVKWSFWRLSRKQNKPSPAPKQFTFYWDRYITHTHTHTKQVCYTSQDGRHFKSTVRQWRGWQWGWCVVQFGQERPLRAEALWGGVGGRWGAEGVQAGEQQVQKKRNKHKSGQPPQSMCSVSAHVNNHTASPPHTNLQAANVQRCKRTCQALYASVVPLYFTGFSSTRFKRFPSFFAFVFYVCIICAISIINMLLCSRWCLWGYLG